MFNVIIGILCIAYGSYTFWLRRAHPERFGKLEAMKLMWGATAGYALHVFGYSLVPIGFGLVLTIAGFLGAPPFMLGD